MELFDDPLEERAVQEKFIPNFSIILTRDEFLETLSQIQAENKMERHLELEETWSAILKVNAHVKANATQGLLNKRKILSLEKEMDGVQEEQKKLKYEVESTSKRIESLKKRMIEEITEITDENEIIKSENIVKKNENDKKWNLRDRKTISSDQIKPMCEICNKEFCSKWSLRRHINRRHSKMGKASTVRTQHCEKVPKEGSEENKRRSTRSFLCDKGAPKRIFFNGELSCPFCNYWAYENVNVKNHMKKIHGITEDMVKIPILT